VLRTGEVHAVRAGLRPASTGSLPRPEDGSAKDNRATLSVRRARGEALVIEGPGDGIAAGTGDLSRLRASDADREQVIELLKAAFVQERLADDEFDVRVGQVLASRTCAELDVVTAGIPARVTAAQPPRTRAQGRVLMPGKACANGGRA